MGLVSRQADRLDMRRFTPTRVALATGLGTACGVSVMCLGPQLSIDDGLEVAGDAPSRHFQMDVAHRGAAFDVMGRHDDRDLALA